MKKLTVMLLAMVLGNSLFGEMQLPKVHSSVMLDSKFCRGGNANQDNYDTKDKFQLRKAALNLSGELDELLSYDVEFGTTTCSGAGDQVSLLEAALIYNFNENLAVGIKKGHVLQSFAGTTECSQRLSMDKSVFLKTFSTCHPLGFSISATLPLGEKMSIETELSLNNGTEASLDDEQDHNLGVIFRTPLEGLSVLGSYNYVEKKYFNQAYEEYSDDGYRIFGGANYENYNLWLTGEFCTGKGFVRDDQKMNAWYVQGGYSFNINKPSLQSIQPYIKYESWETDTDNNLVSTTIQPGVNLKISDHFQLKFGYENELTRPENSPAKAESYILRLQAGF